MATETFCLLHHPFAGTAAFDALRIRVAGLLLAIAVMRLQRNIATAAATMSQAANRPRVVALGTVGRTRIAGLRSVDFCLAQVAQQKNHETNRAERSEGDKERCRHLVVDPICESAVVPAHQVHLAALAVIHQPWALAILFAEDVIVIDRAETLDGFPLEVLDL